MTDLERLHRHYLLEERRLVVEALGRAIRYPATINLRLVRGADGRITHGPALVREEDRLVTYIAAGDRFVEEG